MITVPSASPALMWCVKLLFITGSVDTVPGIEQTVLSRYMADSREPVNTRALWVACQLPPKYMTGQPK